MQKNGIITFLALALATTVGGEIAGAAPPPSILLEVTAQVSTENVTPSNQGNNYRYLYEIQAGDSIVDTLPVEICSESSSTAEPDGYPVVLSFGLNGQGGNLPGVALPANVTFAGNGCQTANIVVNSGALAEGGYNKLINIQKASSDPANTSVSFSMSTIHIQVKSTDDASGITCFITDSNFNYLADCDGALVTSGDDGRFAIVANKKGTQVATNPGQFYYNVLWTNSSNDDVVVDVSFNKDGVLAKGAQAIHAEVFPPYPVLAVDRDEFDVVNDGIPGGRNDLISGILVPAGWTLWVDYHLEWAELGLPLNGINDSCAAANGDFSVTATISSGNTILGACSAGASGYKK